MSAAGKPTRNTLSVWDRRTGRSYLVDTGADVSVFPVSKEDKSSRKNSAPLIAANGSSIKTWGQCTIPLNIGSKQPFTHNFYIADVTRPILGADFFCKHNLAIDLANRRLIDLSKNLTLRATPDSTLPLIAGLATSAPNKFSAMLHEFPNILIPRFVSHSNKHGVEHHIITEGRPVHAKARRLSPEKLAIAKEEFATMVELGICRPSNSPWSSALHVVPKPNGGWRPCGDYRRLNKATTDDRYPLPHIQDFNTNLAGAAIFSKIDLARGYHQIPMAADSIPKTATITPFGLFEFLRMPFGLKNAGPSFQRLVDSIFRDVPGVFVYLDDILIASTSTKDHEQDLRRVFQLLDDNGLVIRKDKCVFGVSELNFLGHRVTTSGVLPLSDRVSVLQDYKVPDTKAALQRFLGMINYYHRFMPHIAGKLKPLHVASSGKGKSIEWTSDCQTAFDAAKSALARATLLHHPRPNTRTSITTDASDIAIGGQLEQKHGDTWKPIAFFSRKLSAAEKNYSAFDRELLAVYSAIRHFRHFVEGQSFTAFTDHKPLTTAIDSATDRSPRQSRHLSYISEFTTDIQHVSGKHNIVADALSRITAIGSSSIDYNKLAIDQNSEEITAYRTAITGLTLEDIPFGQVTILCDTSTGKPRPVIPQTWTRKIFDAVHGLSHAGSRPTQRAISARFVWHGMKKDIQKWCRECEPCQMSKISRHTKSPLVTPDPPAARFADLHVDLVGPLPLSEGMSYLFTIIDRFTRWPEAIPIPDSKTETCAKAFIRHWLARFGVPTSMVSDRGAQFTSDLWKELNKLLGINASTTTAYHPQANGMVERLHRHLKASLKARLPENPYWMEELPLVLLGVRTAWKEDPDCSPAELVYGSSLAIPGEFLPPTGANTPAPNSAFLDRLRAYMRSALPPPPLHHGTRDPQVPRNLASTGYVFVRIDATQKPLSRPYSGPHRIIEVGDKYFTLDINGRQDKVSIDRLKVAHLPSPLTTTQRSLPEHPASPPASPLTHHTNQPRATNGTTPTPLPTSRFGRPRRLPVRFR